MVTLPPQPQPDFDTEGFWKATAEGRLALCRCTQCRRWLQPPLERCPRCENVTAFEDVAGTGTVYSFVVQRQPSVAGYVDAVPYTVALVELDEQTGLRLPARVVGVEPDAVQVGMQVTVAFEALPGGGFTVPVFRPTTVEEPRR